MTSPSIVRRLVLAAVSISFLPVVPTYGGSPEEDGIRRVTSRFGYWSAGNSPDGKEYFVTFDEEGEVNKVIPLQFSVARYGSGDHFILLSGDPRDPEREVEVFDVDANLVSRFCVPSDRSVGVWGEILVLGQRNDLGFGSAFDLEFLRLDGSHLRSLRYDKVTLYGWTEHPNGHWFLTSIDRSGDTPHRVLHHLDPEGRLIWRFDMAESPPSVVVLAASARFAVVGSLSASLDGPAEDTYHLLDEGGSVIVSGLLHRFQHAVFSPDERYVVLVGSRAIHLLRTVDGSQVWSSRRTIRAVGRSAVAFSPDGNRFCVVGQYSGTPREYRPAWLSTYSIQADGVTQLHRILNEIPTKGPLRLKDLEVGSDGMVTATTYSSGTYRFSLDHADGSPTHPSFGDVLFYQSLLQPRVFLKELGPWSGGRTASTTVTSRGGSVPVEAIGRFNNPASMVRSGNLLYISNTAADNRAKVVTVVDISTSGAEVVVDEFDTSLTPVDLAVAHDRVYVIDENRNPLSYRPLAGGEWTDIPLPNGTITEWSSGDIIYPLDNRLMVIHMWENLIDVVNADTDTVELTIDDLEFLPNRIVFTDEYMIVLGVGLSAPSCSADGPNFSVFNLSDLQKVYQKDISGQCALSITHLNGLVYVIFETQIVSYDLETGDQVNSFDTPLLGRHANTDGQSIIVQTSTGLVLKIDAGLTATRESASVLAGPQIWYPPIQEMVAADAADGRLFVTNGQDGTLSIAFFTPESSSCEGDANGDGVVDPLDSGFVLSRLGCPVGTGDPNCDAADQNGDGNVDPLDVGFVLSRFGPC